MIALISTLALVLAPHLHPAHELGAAVVCAEARGASAAEQRAVAAVVRNRARAIGDVARVVFAPRQFARPCPPALIEDAHREAWRAGWAGEGLPEWWAEDVRGFATHRSARRVERRWTQTYAWRRVDAGEFSHRFYAGSLIRTAAKRGRE